MSDKIKITGLTQLECRYNGVRLPNTTPISLFLRSQDDIDKLTTEQVDYNYNFFLKGLQVGLLNLLGNKVLCDGRWLDVSLPNEGV